MEAGLRSMTKLWASFIWIFPVKLIKNVWSYIIMTQHPARKQWYFQYKEPFSHCSTPTPRTTTHPLWPTKMTKHFAVLKPQWWNQLSMCQQQKSPVNVVNHPSNQINWLVFRKYILQSYLYLAMVYSFYPIDKSMFSCFKYKSNKI